MCWLQTPSCSEFFNVFQQVFSAVVQYNSYGNDLAIALVLHSSTSTKSTNRCWTHASCLISCSCCCKSSPAQSPKFFPKKYWATRGPSGGRYVHQWLYHGEVTHNLELKLRSSVKANSLTLGVQYDIYNWETLYWNIIDTSLQKVSQCITCITYVYLYDTYIHLSHQSVWMCLALTQHQADQPSEPTELRCISPGWCTSCAAHRLCLPTSPTSSQPTAKLNGRDEKKSLPDLYKT